MPEAQIVCHGLRGLPHLRLERNLKQGECAELLGVSQGRLSDIERGRRDFRFSALLEWANKLKTSLDTLVFSPEELRERNLK